MPSGRIAAGCPLVTSESFLQAYSNSRLKSAAAVVLLSILATIAWDTLVCAHPILARYSFVNSLFLHFIAVFRRFDKLRLS